MHLFSFQTVDRKTPAKLTYHVNCKGIWLFLHHLPIFNSQNQTKRSQLSIFKYLWDVLYTHTHARHTHTYAHTPTNTHTHVHTHICIDRHARTHTYARLWCNCFRCKKWTQWSEFNTWTRLFTFNPLGKVINPTILYQEIVELTGLFNCGMAASLWQENWIQSCLYSAKQLTLYCILLTAEEFGK